MENRDETPPEPTPWDRVGQFFGDMATVGQQMADRNLTLWNQVAEHLKKRPYKADDLAQDAATVLNTAMENAQAAWSFWTRTPEREAVATALPLAVLYYSLQKPRARVARYMPSDPVWIRVPIVDGETLPPTAQFDLLGPDEESARKLRDQLTVNLGGAGRAYKVQGGALTGLGGGTYTGLVYLTKEGQIRPLASIRIIVEYS